ncbi:Fc receptor-like protein 5 isoform X2 [Xenopus laevis]|uniref:Fc receptor-like protein 5 isoform X2 n=1 Tax=Xenopus laevis TaxID=8355 RepID=A0A8J1KVS3_XENLA|nr:Fc receptor-like protein 5 isoform X2 [Xenopus laevis]
MHSSSSWFFCISLCVLETIKLYEDQPVTPALTINPKYPLYFEGEDVNLVCEHQIYPYTGGYKFRKNNRELNNSSGDLASALFIHNMSRKDSGTYECQYWLSEHQRVVHSPRSKPQTLSVTALSTAPLLLFQPPYSTLIVGETVSMECLAPSTVSVSLYRFYYEEREVASPSTTHSGQLVLRNLTKEHNGNYICMYWSAKNQREIPSFPSATKELYIIDPLQPPVLSLDPPSGRIWDGGNVTLFCTTPIVYENTTFHFLNDREAVFINNTSKAQMKMVITMSLSNATSVFKYSCQYTAYIKGRALTSPRSHPAEITIITGSALWLIAIAVAAGVTVLIIVFLLFYWICLARRDSTDGEQKSQSSEENGKTTTGLRMQQRSSKD